MHTDVIAFLTASLSNHAHARPTYGNTLTLLSHHINHYSEAARILTTGPRQDNPLRTATPELFYCPGDVDSPENYTHYRRTIAPNTQLVRLPIGFATPNTHPAAYCIGLLLHGHLIITWSQISQTTANATTAVHYYNPKPSNLTNRRFNRFGPSNVYVYRKNYTTIVSTPLGFGDSPLDMGERTCVAINDYHTPDLT